LSENGWIEVAGNVHSISKIDDDLNQTWFIPKLMKGGDEGGGRTRAVKARDVSDKVELRFLGSTFQSCGKNGRGKQKGNRSWGAKRAEKRTLKQQCEAQRHFDLPSLFSIVNGFGDDQIPRLATIAGT